MKKRNFIYAVLVIVFALSTIFDSCKKDEEATADDNDTQSVNDNALAENLFNGIFIEVDDAIKTKEDSLYNSKKKGFCASSKSGCLKITLIPLDTMNWPKYLTLDYGTTNCLCNDGIYRRGKILAIFTNRFHKPNAKIIIDLDTLGGFYVNNHKIEGKKILTNKGRNTNNNLVFGVDVQHAKITSPNGKYISWNMTSEREWVNGENTIFCIDDEYSITGSRNGINSNGKSYTVTIRTPLNVAFGCRWIRSGTLEITTINRPVVTVDYGNGNCDPKAVMIINGKSYPFIMK